MNVMQVDTYTQEREAMQRVTREEYLARLKRESSGFTRGVSKYRGVARYSILYEFQQLLTYLC